VLYLYSIHTLHPQSLGQPLHAQSVLLSIAQYPHGPIETSTRVRSTYLNWSSLTRSPPALVRDVITILLFNPLYGVRSAFPLLYEGLSRIGTPLRSTRLLSCGSPPSTQPDVGPCWTISKADSSGSGLFIAEAETELETETEPGAGSGSQK